MQLFSGRICFNKVNFALDYCLSVCSIQLKILPCPNKQGPGQDLYIHSMNSKTIALILTIIGAAAVVMNQAQAPADASEFQTWKSTHGVKYQSAFEESYRERIFLKNLAKIKLHNSNEHNTYKMGVNQFTAMTDDEFVQTFLGTIVPTEAIVESADMNDISLGDDVDWVSQGAVTGVKNQGICGACWAFSTTGALEGLSKLAYGKLQSFSEQQLVDCSSPYGNQGCNGGLMNNAFKYVRDKGIVTEDEYPFRYIMQACSPDGGPFKISGFTDIKNCNALSKAIKSRPISVAVDATNWSAYRSGVFKDCKTSLNHGVLLVGVEGGNWKVKNSWGETWGDSGFITLAAGNTCGICNVASYPNK